VEGCLGQDKWAGSDVVNPNRAGFAGGCSVCLTPPWRAGGPGHSSTGSKPLSELCTAEPGWPCCVPGCSLTNKLAATQFEEEPHRLRKTHRDRVHRWLFRLRSTLPPFWPATSFGLDILSLIDTIFSTRACKIVGAQGSLTEPDHRWWVGSPDNDGGRRPRPCRS
jgi:hypothetical protein